LAFRNLLECMEALGISKEDNTTPAWASPDSPQATLRLLSTKLSFYVYSSNGKVNRQPEIAPNPVQNKEIAFF